MGDYWQGRLVRLRAVRPDDWRTFFELNREVEFARTTDMVIFPESPEWVQKWTAEQAVADPSKHQYVLVIETLPGEFAGTLATHTCNPRVGTFSYGVTVAGPQRRRGYASEAIRLLLRFFFDELRYQKCNVHVYAFNEGSLALHRRLGFVEEGRLRRQVYTEGRFHDEVIFGLTAEEFAAGAAGAAGAPGAGEG